MRRISSLLVLLCLLASARAGAQQRDLTFETSIRFSGAGNCAFCHVSDDPVLTTVDGRDVSPVTGWRGTMMAHAAVDPVWRAAVRHEASLLPGADVERACSPCHAPVAHTESARAAAPLAISGFSALEREGVTCTACHQIGTRGLGTPASYSGGYHIGDSSLIFGPYPDPIAGPMRNFVDYTPTFAPHVERSELCATCHTLFTPAVDAAGRTIGSFPEQTPYLEWKQSAAAAAGMECQTCHMPEVAITAPVSVRPPWLDARDRVWEHVMVGANAQVPRLLRSRGLAGDTTVHADASTFDALIARAIENAGDAATVRAEVMRDDGLVRGRILIENKTGHKLPTGFPARRTWLRVTLADSTGRVLFTSGAHDAEGRIAGEDVPLEPHHTTIRTADDVVIYEAVASDAGGAVTHDLLRAVRHAKDTRIPPSGFSRAAMANDSIAVVGIGDDGDFNDAGCGCDAVALAVDLGAYRGAVRVTAELLYQPLGAPYLAHIGRHLEATSDERALLAAPLVLARAVVQAR